MIALFVATLLSAGEIRIPRLSPLPIEMAGEQVNLSGIWLFHPSPEAEFWKREAGKDWKEIEVPGEWVMQGFEVERGKAAGYYRTFSVPVSWRGKRIKLRCNAIYSEAHIYINGQPANSHLGGFTAFEIDVTSHVQIEKENRIAIAVVSETIADSTANASRYAVHPLGGITRDLFLFALPEENLSMFHVSTAFDSTYIDATLTAEVEISNESLDVSGKRQLAFTLEDAEGKPVPLRKADHSLSALAAGEKRLVKLAFDVKSPKKWDSEHPYLYTLTCRLKEGKQIVQTVRRRVGFRQVEVRGNRVFVNNHPIKLHGVCRHEVMPLCGRSVNDDIWRKDVELFRRGNVNYIRTSHYPPDEALLEACDELGMFVEVEAPFCWAHETKVPEEMHDSVLVNQHIEMVNLNRSHPSILMWSMGNESNLFEEYFRKAAEVVHQIDPTRPRLFSQWGPDADNGLLEITNHHYPGPTGPDTYRKSKRPVVFDEFCHLNAYNRLELAADPGLRNMWGVLLDRMWTAMYESEGVLGGAIWAGIDDTFFLPGERAVGYGTWGPIDGWRREKPEYWGMKKSFTPVKIHLKENMDAQGVVRFDIENRYNFSDLSETEIRWKAGGEQGIAKIELAPHSEGSFEIALPETTRNEKSLEITVIGSQGFAVDAYRFQILPEVTEERPLLGAGQLAFDETSDAFTIQSVGGVFHIDKRNGRLTSERNEKCVLIGGPDLMVLPLNAEGEGIQMVGKDQTFKPFTPVCKYWQARALKRIQEEKGICVRVEGTYKEAEGYFEYRFRATGEVEITYQFTMLEEISPRQTGIVFALPESFATLSWKRKGYWSLYPENHIGALEGEAKLFNPSLPISGLAGPSRQPAVDWSLDQTAAGSNLFRSTKENIYTASLYTAGNANQVTVISNGSQHLRAWKEDGLIRFLVADYNNAGNDTFLTSHSSKDFRPLRRGDRVCGTVVLRIK